MRILIFSDSAWDNTNSMGNTYSNFFLGWDSAEFANIFLREANPDNDICKNYYRITDKMLLKNIFCPKKIGYQFTVSGNESLPNQSSKNEKKLISLIHRYNLKIVYPAERILWRLKGWQNKRLENYIKDFSPDIVFSFMPSSVPRYLMLKYLHKKTNAKIVLFITDNVYGKNFGKKDKMRPEVKRFREIIKMADKLYGASEEICRVYGNAFEVSIAPLYKGCDFKSSVKSTVGSPISIVYAGNLLYGRIDTLMKLAKEIDKINKEEQNYYLKIYSGTPINDTEKEKINVLGSSEFCGLRKYDEIKQILSESDIVLHIESFEPNQIEYVKYSFSTKIIDCLQSGSVLMVIGPRGISSVEYPKRIPGAIVVDDINDIYCALQDILGSTYSLPERAAAIRLFASKNHSLESMHRRLQVDFSTLVEKKK